MHGGDLLACVLCSYIEPFRHGGDLLASMCTVC